MQRCPEKSCCRAGDDLGNCGHSELPCPTPVKVDPERDVVIACNRPGCNFTRSADARDLMSGRVRLSGCQVDPQNCEARIVDLRPKPKAPTAPKPATTQPPVAVPPETPEAAPEK